MTAREIAKAWIRPYVVRGDTLQSLVDGAMGRWCPAYSAQIGGHLWTDEGKRLRSLTARQIAVKPAGGAWGVFSLVELYDELCREVAGEPVQGALW